MGISKKERQRQVANEMNRCVHFIGIQHEVCKVGINYRNLIGGPDFGWAKHLPCLNDKDSPVSCANATFPTEEQAETAVSEREVKIAEFLNDLASGVCPTCKITVNQRQVGHCVYGSCGHRLYQGKVDPRFRETKIHSQR